VFGWAVFYDGPTEKIERGAILLFGANAK
jgi:hypothetical protein